MVFLAPVCSIVVEQTDCQIQNKGVLVQLSNPKPRRIKLALFARRSFTPPVITTAKEESTALVTFEQILSDLESTPLRAIH
jgi:hypothetical protein